MIWRCDSEWNDDEEEEGEEKEEDKEKTHRRRTHRTTHFRLHVMLRRMDTYQFTRRVREGVVNENDIPHHLCNINFSGIWGVKKKKDKKIEKNSFFS